MSSPISSPQQSSGVEIITSARSNAAPVQGATNDVSTSDTQQSAHRTSSSPEIQHICEHCDAKPNGRNLVVALDGTMNQFGLKYSNVVDIYKRIDKDRSQQVQEQLTYYNSGVGTYAKPSRKLTPHMAKTALASTLDLAIAWKFEKIVLAAYRWLTEHYRPGDRIFLFGFSRGAYQVRVLAAMISRVGLLKPGNQEQIPFAFELYLSDDEHMCEQFKATFSDDAPTHFLGVWDSVSSVGLIRGKGYPLAQEGNHICYIRHALALDERRVKFVPEEYYTQHGYKRNGTSPLPSKYISEMEPRGSLKDARERLKEVWFVGCHADIGGTTVRKPEKHLIDEFPAMWMANEARFAGLCFTEAHPHWDFHVARSLTFHESLRSFWYLLEIVPFLGREEDHPHRHRWILPHCGARRYIKRHQKIHVSVAYVHGYQPKARFWPHSGYSWDGILEKRTLDDIEKLNKDPVIELDLYDHSSAFHLVHRLHKYVDPLSNPTSPTPLLHDTDVDDALARLSILAVSDRGCHAILDAAIKSTSVGVVSESAVEAWDLWEDLKFIVSSSKGPGITTRIRALRFMDYMTGHSQGLTALRQVKDIIDWFIRYREEIKSGVETRDNGLLLSAVTRTLLNILRWTTKDRVMNSTDKCFMIDLPTETTMALLTSALVSDNAPEAIAAIPLVLSHIDIGSTRKDAVDPSDNDLGSVSTKLLDVFTGRTVLPHIKVIAAHRLCQLRVIWRLPQVHAHVNDSLISAILALLGMTAIDIVIPALLHVSAYCSQRPRTSSLNSFASKCRARSGPHPDTTLKTPLRTDLPRRRETSDTMKVPECEILRDGIDKSPTLSLHCDTSRLTSREILQFECLPQTEQNPQVVQQVAQPSPQTVLSNFQEAPPSLPVEDPQDSYSTDDICGLVRLIMDEVQNIINEAVPPASQEFPGEDTATKPEMTSGNQAQIIKHPNLLCRILHKTFMKSQEQQRAKRSPLPSTAVSAELKKSLQSEETISKILQNFERKEQGCYTSRYHDLLKRHAIQRKVKEQWKFLAASFGCDTELLSRFIELLQGDQTDLQHRSFARWLKRAVEDELAIARARIIDSLAYLVTSDDLSTSAKKTILHDERFSSVMSSTLLSGTDDAIVMVSGAMFHIIQSYARDFRTPWSVHADQDSVQWFKDKELLDQLAQLLRSSNNVHVQFSVARVLSRFIENGDVLVKPGHPKSRNLMQHIRNYRKLETISVKALLGPYMLQWISSRHEDARKMAIGLLPILAFDSPNFQAMMRKRKSVRELFDLEEVAGMKALEDYSDNINMKRHLITKCKELGRGLQNSNADVRGMAQRYIRSWISFEPFRTSLVHAKVIPILGKVLHSDKDDKIKRSVIDVLGYLAFGDVKIAGDEALRDERTSSNSALRDEILSPKLQFVPNLVKLLGSGRRETTHAAITILTKLVHHDQDARQRILNTDYIVILANLHRETTTSTYIREAAMHALHAVYESPGVQDILSKHHLHDMHNQIQRFRDSGIFSTPEAHLLHDASS